MKKYTMGTGGGPGESKNFATWETWDERYILLYTLQDANLNILRWYTSGTSFIVFLLFQEEIQCQTNT
jgi:hypothetical protein